MKWKRAILTILLGASVLSLKAQSSSKDSLTVAFITGDDEYHSREVMLPYAEKLRKQFGFRTIYIKDEAPGADFAPNKDPQPRDFPELKQIREADLLVVFIRFRAWKPESLKYFLEHFEKGKPAIGIRTTTHAFWRDRTFAPKYFGGHYKTHNTRHMVGQVNPEFADHPVLRGVDKKFESRENGPYVTTPLTEGTTPLVLSYGHNRKDKGIGTDSYDSPTFPVAWTFNDSGARRVMITLGNDRSGDHEWSVMQNLFYNSVFWTLKLEIPKEGVLNADADTRSAEQQEFKPVTEKIPASPDFVEGKDWEMLFDGSSLDKWRHWDISIPPYGIPLDRRANSEGPIDYSLSPARWKIEDSVLIVRTGYGDIITREDFSNYTVRFDFLIPATPDWVKNEWKGNSGIFLNGSYEIALLDSYGKQPSKSSNGAIYGLKAPSLEASRKAGEWQTMEITSDGSKATVVLNGKTIHKEVPLSKPTFNGFPAGKIYADRSWQKNDGIMSEGPIRLQSENSPVRFANIAIKRIHHD